MKYTKKSFKNKPIWDELVSIWKDDIQIFEEELRKFFSLKTLSIKYIDINKIKIILKFKNPIKWHLLNTNNRYSKTYKEFQDLTNYPEAFELNLKRSLNLWWNTSKDKLVELDYNFDPYTSYENFKIYNDKVTFDIIFSKNTMGKISNLYFSERGVNNMITINLSDLTRRLNKISQQFSDHQPIFLNTDDYSINLAKWENDKSKNVLFLVDFPEDLMEFGKDVSDTTQAYLVPISNILMHGWIADNNEDYINRFEEFFGEMPDKNKMFFIKLAEKFNDYRHKNNLTSSENDLRNNKLVTEFIDWLINKSKIKSKMVLEGIEIANVDKNGTLINQLKDYPIVVPGDSVLSRYKNRFIKSNNKLKVIGQALLNAFDLCNGYNPRSQIEALISALYTELPEDSVERKTIEENSSNVINNTTTEQPTIVNNSYKRRIRK